MDRETYRALYDRLVTDEDVHRVAKEDGWDPELLFVIHTHRITRDATRRFYVVKRQMPRVVAQWRHGRRMLDIAREWKFPPVLMGQMVLQELKLPRKKIWGCFLDPESAPDARLRHEIKELLSHDPIYSPDGMERQRERGRKGEERLYRWLENHGIKYRTEKELRGKFRKTPDALLDEPIIFYGQKLSWIESKANFGDDVELRKNLKRQLGPYTEMFGEGAVVYWYGYIEGAETPAGILLWDGATIESITPVLAPPAPSGHAGHRSQDPVRPRSPAAAPSAPREAPVGPGGGPPP